MHVHTAVDGNVKYRRVRKPEARKAFDAGKPVIFCPCNLYPFGSFRPSIMVQKTEHGWTDFAYTVQNFEWYNCCNETGRYTAFYLAVDGKGAQS